MHFLFVLLAVGIGATMQFGFQESSNSTHCAPWRISTEDFKQQGRQSFGMRQHQADLSRPFQRLRWRVRSQVAWSFCGKGGGLGEPLYASLPPIAISDAYDSSTTFFKNILATLHTSTCTKSDLCKLPATMCKAALTGPSCTFMSAPDAKEGWCRQRQCSGLPCLPAAQT